jgi:hypothetical protein
VRATRRLPRARPSCSKRTSSRTSPSAPSTRSGAGFHRGGPWPTFRVPSSAASEVSTASTSTCDPRCPSGSRVRVPHPHRPSSAGVHAPHTWRPNIATGRPRSSASRTSPPSGCAKSRARTTRCALRPGTRRRSRGTIPRVDHPLPASRVPGTPGAITRRPPDPSAATGTPNRGLRSSGPRSTATIRSS